MSESRFLRLWIVWQVLLVGLVLLGPTYVKFAEPPWAIPAEHVLHVLGLASSAAASSILLTLCFLRTGGKLSSAAAFSIPAVMLGGLFLSLLVLRVSYSRMVLLVGSGLIVALLPAPLVGVRLGLRRSLALFVGILLAGGLMVALAATFVGSRIPQFSKGVVDSLLYTGYHVVDATSYSHYMAPHTAHGGGIEVFGDGYLVVNGDGDFYRLRWENGSDSLDIRPLGLRVPLNRGEFDADTEDAVRLRWFRVTDLLVKRRGERTRLLVPHHFWNRGSRCFVLRLSALELPAEEKDWAAAQAEWTTVYDTRPCLQVIDDRKGVPFDGRQGGGRLAQLDAERVLLTVGDHGFDGWTRREAYGQDVNADYGKTLVVNVAAGSAEIFTLGHRNPQGLHIDDGEAIWLTEHGPQGGDELNVLEGGRNYGWPFATYGTEYGQTTWPLLREADLRGEFEPPFYSWLPSIGISSLISVRGTLFREWRNDLLISSLNDESLWRLRIRRGRVASAERVEIGERIRDLVEGPDGRIILWTDTATIVSLRPARPDGAGAVAFGQCVGCHRPGDGASYGIGPPLTGVYGRRVASATGYRYSPALESLEGRWTEERLDAFLENPQNFAPGTTMEFQRIKDSEERRALIDHLKTLR